MEVVENELKAAIERQHGGTAQLAYVDAVSETFRGGPAWNGLVLVFDLPGHPRAERAYAWSVPVENSNQPQLYVALHGPLIASAHDAVRAVMVKGPKGSPEVREAMLAAIPSLRAFAISLTNNLDAADDLVRDAILRAWANIDRFELGTNINAWLFTILLNAFYSQYRKARRLVEDPDGSYAARL